MEEHKTSLTLVSLEEAETGDPTEEIVGLFSSVTTRLFYFCIRADLPHVIKPP